MERRVTITYFAVDGTEFESERECVEYEEALSNRRKHFKAYDENFDEVFFENLDKIVFVHIIDEEGISMWNEENPWDRVSDIGMFYWDAEDGEFCDLGDEMFNLKNKLNRLEKAYNTMCAKADE